MNNSFFQTAEKLNKEHRRTRRWHKVITVMAAIVVFCTTYALILPAITWERHLLCDTKEHTHATSCYADVVVTPEKRELTCPAAEHVHGDSCYEEVTTYICGLEEGENHQHTADCMQTERVLTCEQSEHTHGDSCYHITPAVTERELICNKPEHVHSDACYDAPPSSDSGYYCGYAEHSHNENCYFEDGTLRCTMQEHTHTLSCQIDKTADLETATEWERTFADVKLGDNWAENVLAIADTQLGYTESAKNFVIDDEKTGAVRGYSRYGAWYGDPYGDWCAMFASFCIDHAGVKNFPLDSNCGTWIKALSNEDCLLYHPAGSYLENYMPQPGDLIFFDWDAEKKTEADENAVKDPAEVKETKIELTEAEKAEAEAKLIEQATHDVDHVGLVYELIEATDTKPAQIKTIEGNNGNTVAYHTYDLDDVRLLGYGQLPEAYVRIYHGDDYTVTARFDKDAGIPSDAVLKAEKIPHDSALYEQYYQQSVQAMLDQGYANTEEDLAISYLQFYDIGFYVDGKKIEPTTPVSIVISNNDELNPQGGRNGTAIHFGADGTEILDATAEISGKNKTENSFSFVQDSFSVTGVMLAAAPTTTYEPVTTLQEGDQVIIQLQRSPNYYLTNTVADNGVTLSANLNDAKVWTIEKRTSDGVMLFKSSTGQYLTVGNNSAGLGGSYRAEPHYQNGYWILTRKEGNTTYYLNQYGGSSSTRAAGYGQSSDNDDGSRWIISKVVEQPATNGTVRNGTGSSTTYIFDVYVQQVDSFNNPLGQVVKIGTETADSTRTKDGNPIVPSAVFENAGVNGTYVNAYYGTPSATDNKDNVTKVYWYHRDGSSNYYLGVTANGTDNDRYFNGASSDNALYIQYRVDSGGGGGGDDADKPTYPAYLPTSPQKTGEAQIGDVKGNYWSDAATSQLESLFNGVKADDGKVLTDKSVIYKGDDYGAFTSYADNTFGVTLSALGQKYPITEEFDIHVPLDVVFVLDTSGSMINTKYDGVTSANIMIESLNQIMAKILEQNEDNRVGVVCFSGQSTKLLDLGRYTAADDKFFKEGMCNSNTYQLTPNSSIQRTDGDLYKGTFNAGWYGTYTQHGIAQGAKEFLDNTDTTVTRTITKQTDDGTATATYTATRRPIIILLSDGEPTYCTEDYTSVLASSNVHGNGNTGYNNNGTKNAKNSNNNKGVMGYYTILSAQYYKNAVSAHYNTDAYFYTIGIGINASGNDSYAKSVAGDDYKRTVLDPTNANVAHIQNCSNGRCTDSEISTNQRDISDYTDITCHQLYNLLNSNQSGNITVGSHNANDSAKYGMPVATTSNSVPVISNPYKSYSYANGSFFSADSSVETLTKAFTKAISFSENIPVYGYILKNNSPVTASDPIGEGMEVKSDLVLRYGGNNYTPDHSETKGNVTTYYYKGEYKATDGSGTVVDINKITAQVVKNADGTQTVKLLVPDAQLPAYSPYLKNDGAAKFYYEELPVRLIYQVGLTEQAQKDVAALGDTGGTKTYYTNQWKDTAYADADYQPTSKNPYYNKDNYNKGTINKTENTTETASYSREFSGNSTDKYVDQLLGNNGKLVFSHEVPPQDITLYKVDMNGNKITTGTAEFKLYSDADLKNLVGTYTTKNGDLTIPDLTVGQEYWLKETKAPDGFYLLEEAQKFTVDATGKVNGISSDNAYFKWDETSGILLVYNTNGYELPQSGGSGLIPIYASGILLMAGALVYGYSMRRKRERRQSN